MFFFLCGDKTFACFYLSKEAEKVLFHYVSCTHKFAISSCLSCRYRSITKQFFRKADGVVVMYDITAEESFTAVRQWLTSVKVRQYQSQKHHNPIFVFCFILLTCYKKQTNYIKKQKNKAVLACALSLTCLQEGAGEDIPVMLLGNKTDKETQREVQKSIGERLAKVCVCCCC